MGITASMIYNSCLQNAPFPLCSPPHASPSPVFELPPLPPYLLQGSIWELLPCEQFVPVAPKCFAATHLSQITLALMVAD